MEVGRTGSVRFHARFGSGEGPLEVLRGNANAIAPPHQYAILGPAQIGDAHREPYPDRRQRDGKSERGDIGEHAVAKIVRLLPRTFVARQIERLGLAILMLRLDPQIGPLRGRLKRAARPEWKHAMLFFRCNGLLGFHWCRSGASWPNLARSWRVSQKMLGMVACDKLSI
jgi:hypothetical protein